MNEGNSQSRRTFLGKTLAAVAIAVMNPFTLLLKPKDVLASNGNQTLGLYVINLSDYPALSKVNGSVAITIPHTQYTYPGDIILPFRFILTRDSATSFVAEEGYCTHQQTALDPYNGTLIKCPNPDPGHGSEFALDGSVLRSPARRNLTLYTTAYDAVSNTVTIDVANLGAGDENVPATAPELFQNFPNPVRSGTTIRFKLGYYSKITLTVTDALGHIIAVLTDGELPAGEYYFDFDATIWSSGTYFYHLNAGGEIQSKQMIVVK